MSPNLATGSFIDNVIVSLTAVRIGAHTGAREAPIKLATSMLMPSATRLVGTAALLSLGDRPCRLLGTVVMGSCAVRSGSP